MPTPDPDAAAVADPLALGAFLPDVATIERLANAFFKGANGGAPPASPVVPTSAPAPWSPPPAPGAPVVAQAIPAQPPFGLPDPPASPAPASAPARSFGGASAGSAAPASALASRVAPPAAAQTLAVPPRLYPTTANSAPINQIAASPFSTEIDLRAAVAALRAGLPGHFVSLPDSAVLPGAVTEAQPPAVEASALDQPREPLATPASATALAPAQPLGLPPLDFLQGRAGRKNPGKTPQRLI